MRPEAEAWGYLVVLGWRRANTGVLNYVQDDESMGNVNFCKNEQQQHSQYGFLRFPFGFGRNDRVWG